MKPFYTSKGFWASTLALLVVLYYGFRTHVWTPEIISTAVLLVLDNVFGWSQSQALSLSKKHALKVSGDQERSIPAFLRD